MSRKLVDLYKYSKKARNSGADTDRFATAAEVATAVAAGGGSSADTEGSLENKTLVTPIMSSFYRDAEKTKLMSVPNEASDTLVLLAAAQTLENKTVLAPSLTLKNVTPVNAVAASGTLTLTGVALDGEKVNIGSDVYEFAADDAQDVDAGSIAVDITSYATKAQGTLSMATQPTSGDTITIGEKVYTFVPDGTENADGEVSVGENIAGAQANLVAAINGTDGINTAHTLVTAADFETDACVLTAIIGGTAGNDIATTETFTDETDAFDATKLGTTTAGVDCTAGNAITALAAAITASDTEGVGGVDGEGDTLALTADTAGAAGNSITTTTDMANASFGAEHLENGVDGTVGSAREIVGDGTAIYYCTADNTVADANWKKLTLGSL